MLIPKLDKAITLRANELEELITYIQEYYTPLNIGMTEFISVNDDIAKLFSKIQSFRIPDNEVVNKLMESGILTENLSVAITAAERNRAISEFENAIIRGEAEQYWQKWFTNNKWILGSEYLNILSERDIDEKHIADYLMRSIDGFLDVVEIKKPDLQFWSIDKSHNNLYPSSQLSAAISQCLNYLYRIELKSNSAEFIERVGCKTVKPQCLLIYGRSNNWRDEHFRAFRILNSAYHQLHILTYDQLLTRAKQLLGIEESEEEIEEDYSDLPF